MRDEMLGNTPHILHLSPGVQVAYLGPGSGEGPLPALFYFALSAQESLCRDPFNQPVTYLSGFPLRIFSMTLPSHGEDLPAPEAMTRWAHELASGHDFLHPFIARVHNAVEELLHRRILIPHRLGVMGLSRGAFIATHVAAHISHFRWLVGFAPLTKLSAIKEFREHPNLDLSQELDLEHLAEKIADRHVRFYIGNLDTRVGTRSCFDFIEKAAQCALHKRIRSPHIELMIGPSIGHQGHGTSQHVFHQGAQWMADKLGVTDAL